MLKYNKYMKELGIEEDYYLFDKTNIENDSRYSPDEDGFVDAEFFQLDSALTIEIYCRLRYFQDHCLVGIPSCILVKYENTPDGNDKAFKKWCEIVQAMIDGFRLRFKADDYYSPLTYSDKKEHYYLSKNKEKKIRFGMRMFMKYYHCLWY